MCGRISGGGLVTVVLCVCVAGLSGHDRGGELVPVVLCVCVYQGCQGRKMAEGW